MQYGVQQFQGWAQKCILAIASNIAHNVAPCVRALTSVKGYLLSFIYCSIELDSRLSGYISNLALFICVLFSDKTHNSHSASFNTGIYE